MAAQLRANALSVIEALVMGVAGSAPGFSIAVTLAALLGTAGLLAPGALLIFAVPMVGISLAYKGLCARMANAGAAYEWTSRIFNRTSGYFSGWALLVASTVFMVTGAVPLGTATLSFLPDPSLADNVVLTTAVGAVWFIAIGVVLITGISLTSKVQMVMSTIELAILTFVVGVALWRGLADGPVNAFSWRWFALGYSPGAFAASALIVVFFYWGWDVTANLGEETDTDHQGAGNGGFFSVFVTTFYFLAFAAATLFLFSLRDGARLSDNLIYHLAVRAGLGRAGGLAASAAVILSSVATLETQMLQFSRTLFAMGRDGAMPRAFGVVEARTQTPVRTMYLLLGLGLAMMLAASFVPTVSLILTDSVKAIAVQVCYYYSVAGLACAWAFRDTRRSDPRAFLVYVVYPGLSAAALIALAIYALTTFDTITRVVGVGGLLAGVLFLRPRGYGGAPAGPAPAPAVAALPLESEPRRQGL
jgi:amino acid transporter